MRFGSVRNHVRTYSRANRDVPTAFEHKIKDSDGIRGAFQLNSCNIKIDSGSNRDAFEVHSSSFEAHSGHSGRIWSGLPFRFSLECDQNVLNAFGMLYEYLECSQSAVRIRFECRSIFLHFECTSKVLSMSKTFGPATRMGSNIWNVIRMQSDFLECTSNIQEYTKNFHSDGISAHSASSVTRVLGISEKTEGQSYSPQVKLQERIPESFWILRNENHLVPIEPCNM